MRLLVTGGSGFLGEYVLTEAARRGHEMVALARSDAAAVTVARRGARPITVTEDTNQLVGRNPDLIVRAAREVLAAPLPDPASRPCGTGRPVGG